MKNNRINILNQSIEEVEREINVIDLHRYSYKYRTEQEKSHGFRAKKVSLAILEQIRQYLSGNHKKLFQESIVDERKREKLGEIIADYITQQAIVVPGFNADDLLKHILHALAGLGPIQPLMENEDITEIMVNGKNEVYVEENGREYKTDITFSSDEELLEVAMKIVNAAGESLTSAKPYVDCRFPGMRINIVNGLISGLGIVITIRKFAKDLRINDETIVTSGQASREMLDAFEVFVKGKMNILIAGPTGSGKTELFKYLVKHIPDDERLLMLEDTAETRLKDIYPQKHIVPMECRFTSDPSTTVDYTVLLKNSLRQKPTRVAVGEVRGPEAVYMLEIFNTGHEGGFTTGHANSCADTVERLVMMCLRSGMKLEPDIIGKWVAKTFDIVIFQEKMDDKVRRITEVVELVDYENGRVIYRPLFQFIPHKFEKEGNKITKIHGTHKQTGFIRLETAKRLFSRGISVKKIKPLLSEEDRGKISDVSL
ncbi:Flp pilus assembly complex ATPase component TadA [Microaerobacter geothermalis]|nr:Flp pilus assembly complex ATPase component TadA [Microaerobacter geothermalis]